VIDLLKKLGALALLPLSVLPVVLSLPKVEDEYAQFEEAYLNREALPAPGVEDRDWKPVRVPEGRVPVLTYHGIEDRPSSPYSITRKEFARQMAMLDELGFRTIGIETYTRWLEGEEVRLPDKPILVTFDDGQLDSFRGADAVLERHRFRATMFAIAGESGERGGFYSTWDELLQMRDSGRWDIQLHAGHGHHPVPTGPNSEGPYYANRVWNGREAGLEDFGAARDRIIGDILWGMQEMRDHMRDFQPHAFAVPFGDFGQHETNDRRIPAMLRPWMAHQFRVIFVQAADPPFSRPGGATEIVQRFEVQRDTSADEVHDWLGRYGLRR
jgi:hypothetical protein